MADFEQTPSVDIERAKALRKDSSQAERLLWSRISAKKIGFKFRRQHPVDGYILDFYCHEARLAVELDGLSHDDRIHLDLERDQTLSTQGILTLRFLNPEVWEKIEDVIQAIYTTCLTRTGRDPFPDPKKQ